MKKAVILLLTLFSIHFSAQNTKTKAKEELPTPKWSILGKFSFLFNQSSFSNWASGGQNTIASNISVNYDFNYKKDNVNWDNILKTGYGISHVSNSGLQKTDDRFELNSLFGYSTSKYWFLSFLTNFKTQYSDGFNYSSDPKELVSEFFSPAYLTFGPGMLWKKSDKLNVNIAPATARYIFVSEQFSGDFGVEEGKTISLGLGFNLSGLYKFTLMENIEMENTLTMYSDYLANVGNIDIDYQTNINFKVNESIKMQMTFQTIIDDNSSSKVQFRELFGLGVNYNFHEKVTY
ncbi:DUF3078 domain-containing protein [Polaribacter sp. Asnod1-A03]|uniref:DUF3078 domain-containing protein n=1 Tax=Polaribacter sp. Asnod1-A03 TaxID=3160581 RepID=UPI00386988F2